MARRRLQPAGVLLKRLTLLREGIEDPDEYPFVIPALRDLDELEMAQPVTCSVGENFRHLLAEE